MLLWLMAGVLFVAACGDNAKKVDASAGRTGGAADNKGDLGDTSSPSDLIAGQSLIDATYKITVTVLGMGTCDGDAQLKLNANFGKSTDAASSKLLDLTGTINCPLLGCQMDLGQMVGGAAGPPPGVAIDPNPLVIEDGVMHLKQLGFSKFEPPRPFFPAFLSAKREKLSGLSRSVSLTATDLTDGKQGSGSVNMSMVSFGQSYDASEMGKTFTDSMVFELTTDGFDGMNKVAAVLFDRLQFGMSLKPLALLHLEFEGPVSDLMAAQAAAGGGGGGCGSGGLLGGAGGGAGGGIGGLLGGLTGGGGGGLGGLMGGPFGQIAKQLFMKIINVKMRADLVSMKGVDPNSTSDSDDLGEQIGGKSGGGSSSSSDDEDEDEDE
jgi:hypothetical protein